MNTNMSDHFKDDPLLQTAKQSQQENMQRAFQKFQQFGKYERLIHTRVSTFLIFGLFKFLWKQSKTALFCYLVPFWLYVAFMMGVTGARHGSWGAIVGFGGFALACFAGMAGSMWYGFQQSFGFCRIAAMIQMTVSGCFVLVATYRAIQAPFYESAFQVRSPEAGIAIFVMFLLFIATIAEIGRAHV